MRVAIVHDWLTGMRGGEKVLSLLCSLLPQADLYTLIHVPGVCDSRIEGMRIRTSFLNDLPGVRSYYRYLLPAMPFAAECFDLSEYDLVVSCSHCVAKGVIRSARSAHLCYCFTPMRYAWDQGESYRHSMRFAGHALRLFGGCLRAWDRRSATHVDRFIANSHNVANRIERCYGRSAAVIHSPIDTSFFTPGNDRREDYYLMVGALAPYKRVDQAIEAFAELGRPLWIIGGGPSLNQFRRKSPANVTLMGWQDDKTVRMSYRRCRALIYPGEEDFGLVPLEAMACGAPVIAYGAGGAVETVLDHPAHAGQSPTGILYAPQSVKSLVAAVRQFEDQETRFVKEDMVAWAQQFNPGRFLQSIKHELAGLLSKKGLSEPW